MSAPNLIGAPLAITVFLSADRLEYADWLARNLSRQRNREVTRSEAIEYALDRDKIKKLDVMTKRKFLGPRKKKV